MKTLLVIMLLSLCWTASAVTPPVAPYISGLGAGMTVSWAANEKGIREFDPLAVRDFQQRGISHVKINVSGEPTHQRLVHLGKIVAACQQYKVTPIIAWQGNGRQTSEQSLTRWWSTVARYFHGQYPQLAFDLLDEPPRNNRSSALLSRWYAHTINAVYKIDPQRTMLITPALRAEPEQLPGLHWSIPAGARVIAGWHLFASGPQKINGKTPWSKGTAAEKAAIRARIRAVVHWQQKTGKLSMVTAFSPLTLNGGNTNSARQLASFVACELRQAHIPLTLVGDSRYYDGEEGAWRPAMASLLDASLHPECQNVNQSALP